jgi:xanthine/uracil/vitamin C permease (AzgA family)
VGLRELIFNSISTSLKNGIAAGIGLFIAFVGLQQAGVIVKDPGTAVRLNPDFASPDSIVFFIGMLTTAILHARRVRGSILWGILVGTALACLFKIVLPHTPHCDFRGARCWRVDARQTVRICKSDRCSAAIARTDIPKNGCRPRAEPDDAAVHLCFSVHAHV